MKITQQRENGTNITLSTISIDTSVQKVRKETKTQLVYSFRMQLKDVYTTSRGGALQIKMDFGI